MYFFSPSSQGYLVARWSAWKECGCPRPLCISNTMHRHNVTCKTPITPPMSDDKRSKWTCLCKLIPLQVSLSREKRRKSYSTIFRMYYHNNFLGHPICSKHLCNIQIFSSNITLHWTDSVQFGEKVGLAFASCHDGSTSTCMACNSGSQFTRSSLQSAFMFRIESLKDKNILAAWPRFKRWPERPGLPRVLTGGPAPLSATFSTFSNTNTDL